MAVPSTSSPDAHHAESKKNQASTASPMTSTVLVDDAAPVQNRSAVVNDSEQSGAQSNGALETMPTSELHDSVAAAPAMSYNSPDGGQAPTSSLSQVVQPESAAEVDEPAAPPPALQARGAIQAGQKDKDGDKPEDDSHSLTLTGNKSSAGPARRKANKPSTLESATAPQNGNGNSKPSNNTRTPKPSFLSKLIHILVPCVAPSSRSHPIEIDDAASAASELPSASHEKPGTKAAGHVVPDSAALAAPPKDAGSSSETRDAVEPVILTPLTLQPQTPSVNAEVIVPPTPTTHLLPRSETEGVTSGAVQPPGSTGGSVHHEKVHSRDSTVPSNASEGDDSEGTSFTEDEDLEDGTVPDDLEDEEDKLILSGGAGIPIGADGIPKPLLPPIAPQHVGRKCLILDLDETLVHSSFKSIQQADYVVPVEIEYHWHNVYVIKRPGVDNFLKKMGEIYEVVVFTASLSKYADPVLDKLDIHQVVSHRLFRESCYNHKGNYVKDLSQLGRPIADTIILDNSPASYIFHPNNAVPVSSWFNDPHDTELTDLVPFLADLTNVDDVRGVLDGAR